MEAQTEIAIKKALGYLEKADPTEAIKVLSPLFEYEFDCPPLIFTSACCNFWARRMNKVLQSPESFERGEMLLTDWKEFMQDFVANRMGTKYLPTINASQRGVFSFALQNYETAIKKAATSSSLRRAALCYKKLGNYDESLLYLAKARETEGSQTASAQALAETADCYALCGTDRNAKVLFREAFYLAPDEIDLSLLDSQLIRCLIEKTAALGYRANLLGRWIPVWGTLWGVFCVKRGINATEAIKLRQEIFSLENEMDVRDCDKAAIVPRLLNLYFWYIDYLTLIRVRDSDASKAINDILLKIKILDKDVYEVYKK